MSNFTVCFMAVLPVLLMMLIGYIAKKCNVIKEEDVSKVNGVAFRIFLPVMTFDSIYRSELSTSVRPQLMVFALCAVIVSFALSWIFAEKFVKVRNRKGVVIQGLFRSNYLIIGGPIAANLMGSEELGVIAVLSAVIVPTFNMFAVICLEWYNGKKPSFGVLLKDVLTTPLVVASVLGVLVKLMNLQLPGFADELVADMAAVASPLMLVMLGASIKFDGVTGHMRELVAVCIGRLLVSPAIFLTAGAAIGFRGMEFAALIGVFASSTAAGSYTMAQQMGGDGELAGNIVVITSTLCSFTLLLWSLIFKTLGVI